MKLSFNMIPEIGKIFDEGRDGVDQQYITVMNIYYNYIEQHEK